MKTLMYFRVVSQDLRHCCLFRFFNKVGTYHNTSHNEVWRKPLFEAAIHKDCIDPPDKSCNVCGLQFFPTWAHFMPGNFWTAQCSYINKLLPPCGISIRKGASYKTLLATERSKLDGHLAFSRCVRHKRSRAICSRYAIKLV